MYPCYVIVKFNICGKCEFTVPINNAHLCILE